ncbi:MAG: SHOCT-like domain-containing protein [Candidatus Zixiibacteriota bacterium]
MSEQRKQILQMLADGKITADEAERLINALGEVRVDSAPPVEPEAKSNGKPKFLHVKVNAEPGSHHRHENVDIKIPIILLKAGLKLGSMMPDKVKGEIHTRLAEKGFNFDLHDLKPDQIDGLIQALTESSIDIDSDREKVRIYCA